MPRKAEKRETNRSEKTPGKDRICPFSLLDKEALHAVLLRTRASDHKNLILCCKRFHRAIYSSKFKQARSDLGWAEVTAELLSPREMYEMHRERDPFFTFFDDGFEEYDSLGQKQCDGCRVFVEAHFRVFVDSWPLHKCYNPNRKNFELKIYFLPFDELEYDEADSFYEVCDGCESHDLVYASRNLFTFDGVPRSGDFKTGLLCTGYRMGPPLLYIEKFQLPIEYRSTSSTVAPMILQKILRPLKDEFSVAIYFPSWEAQNRESQEHNTVGEHNQILQHQDMRQFFRAGFHQVRDAIITNDEMNIVYLNPQYIPRSILSQKESLGRRIESSPVQVPLKKKTGLAKDLYNLFKKTCSHFSKATKHSTKPLQMHPLVRDLLSFARSVTTSNEEGDDDDEDDGLMLIDIKNASDEIHGILSKCDTFDDCFKVILDSDAMHLCAEYENLTLIHLLLSLLPNPVRQTKIVLNNLDEKGLTPLMRCARQLFRRELTPEDAEKSVEFVESFIKLGADGSVVHEHTQLSALGFFRLGVRDLRSFRIVASNHKRIGLSKALREKADRIEELLLYAVRYPAPADETVIDEEDLKFDATTEDEYESNDEMEEDSSDEDY